MLFFLLAMTIVVPLAALGLYLGTWGGLESIGLTIAGAPGATETISLVVALCLPAWLGGCWLARRARSKGWDRQGMLTGMIGQLLLLALYIGLWSRSTDYPPFNERSWLYGHTLSMGALYLVFWLAFSVARLRRDESPARREGRLQVAVFALPLVLLIYYWGPDLYFTLKGRLPNSVDIQDYRPFEPESRLVSPSAKPSLSITANHPRLDGATAAFPVYAAIAQAVYRNLPYAEAVERYVSCRATGRAYKMLAEGETDLVFAAPPSPEQIEYGRSQGRIFTETPIAYDAFVFLTHRDNPVDSLTLDQIRDIYTQRILNWKEVGGPNRHILAFQRDKGSGSQTTMLRLVMEGKPMAAPVTKEAISGMGRLARSVMDYRNRRNAIGYSFRWYVTAQYPVSGLKLLKVNGIAPSPENIRSGIYPLRTEMVVVGSGPLSRESQDLLAWITGPEGQALIEKTGYIPISDAE